MSSRLAVEALTKRYDGDEGPITAVSDLDLDVEPGELTILVGPSGCGKSTTLRCIAGLETVTEGTIRIDDEDVTARPARKRDIAMVFQNYALYPHMTARENMAFGLKMRTDLPAGEIDERVEEAAEMMGIGDLLEKHPSEMSGGQQQRVALGRAIVRDPAVFLMDEPLSNLDAKLRDRMRTEILQLQRTLDVTTIYVTHNQTEAMTMGDRIAVLDEGELQQYGTPLECYHRPANRFVASFIGSPSMNLYEGRREGDVLATDEIRYALPESAREAVPEGTDATLGIRPEDVAIVDAADADLELTVGVVEHRGDITYVTAGEGVTETRLTLAGGRTIEEGTTVGVAFPPDATYLFDRETGELAWTEKEPEQDRIAPSA